MPSSPPFFPFPAKLEKTLVGLLVVAFALPLTLGIWLWASQNKAFVTVWLRNATLHGVQIRPEPVAFSRASVFSARFQAACAARYDAGFAGRELFIRVINEVYLRVFHSVRTGVVVGPHLSLVETIYPQEYCLQRPGREALRPLADDLRRMQDFCEARGMAFAVVITPSKAAVYPENLPADWRRRFRCEPRYYDQFLALLREQGIHYVDGHRLAVQMKSAVRAPVFPLGGGHWGDPAALATTNALLGLLAREGLHVRPIQRCRQVLSNRPTGQDRDVADLVNSLLPWHYWVSTVTVQPEEPEGGDHPNLVVVGGSFVWSMLAMLDASREFSELEFYQYYKLAKFCRLDGELHRVAEPTPPVNFEGEVFAADALVLEANEQALPEPNHLVAFLHDALAVLPDPRAAKAPFHYESQLRYAWGDTLSFVAGKNPLNIAATKGFTSPAEAGAYTVGTQASIHFLAPPPPGDMVLEVNAGAFLVDTRLTEQRVSVLANGHPLGEWVWKEAAFSRRELPIPKDFLGGGEVRLEFRIAHPGSRSEFGLGVDSRKFGLLVSDVRLHEAGK